MSEPESAQLDRLERRIERLTSLVFVQCVLLAAVVLMEFGVYVALLLLIAVPLLVFYRKRLPAVARWLGQTVRHWRGGAGAMPKPTEEQST